MWQAGRREPSTSLLHSATGDVGDARPPAREPVFSMYLDQMTDKVASLVWWPCDRQRTASSTAPLPPPGLDPAQRHSGE